MSSTLTQTIAAHWSQARLADLPAPVVGVAKRALLDTIAAGIAGPGTPEVDAVSRGMAALHGTSGQGALLWAQGARLPAAQAALVNGTAAHARELDDFNGCGHSGAVIVPAVCAAADAVGASGRAVLEGVVAGYDVAARMLEAAGGYRVHNGRGWHSTATCGSFGAAAAAAKVLGLGSEHTAHALGIAGTYVGGLWAFMADGTMTKRLHPGKAAENGVTAAFLAQAGMTGPAQILEAQWGGFFPTYCGTDADPSLLVAELGQRQWILTTGIKPYSCCRGSHGGIDALFHLMSTHGFKAPQIEKIVVHGSDYTRKLVGNQRIGTVLDAQMSLPYALAVAAESGRADLPQFDPLRTSHPEVRRLLDGCSVLTDPNLTGAQSPVIEVVLKDGRRLEHQVSHAKGDPLNPVTDLELEAKAASLIVPVLGEARFHEIVAAISNLENVADFRTVSQLLAATKTQSATLAPETHYA